MKTAIITGSSGLIGSEAVEFFAEKGMRVIGIDNDMRSYFFGADASTAENCKCLENRFKHFKVYHNDIRDRQKIEEIFNEYSSDIDLIIHTAAQH